MIDVSFEETIKFAKDCYRLEPGRRKAIDEKRYSLTELAIYHYINDLTNKNTPSTEDPDDYDVLYMKTLKKMFIYATNKLPMNALEVELTFDKVRKIPRA